MAPFELFQGRRLDDLCVVTDVRRRVILKGGREDLDWGPDSLLSARTNLAAAMLFHCGLGVDLLASEALAVIVISKFPEDEWALTAAALYDWHEHYNHTKENPCRRRKS
jgi:hypothetical protein